MRVFGSGLVFMASLLAITIVSTGAWDTLINGKLYFCTDGGTLDFIFVGDWVHHPESVARVVPRTMGESDEIKAGWSIAGLWFLWISFIIVSISVSAMLARIFCLVEKAGWLKTT